MINTFPNFNKIMRRIGNLLGLLFLIYFAYNYRNWHLGIKENNILSTIIVKPLQWIPNWIIMIFVIIIIIIYISEVIQDKKEYKLYFITFGLVTMITKICVSILMLEDVTDFSLFYVAHPVPVELKLIHFKNTVSLALESIPKEEFTHIYNVLSSHMKNDISLLRVASDIKSLNATEITVYVEELFNSLEIKYKLIIKNHLSYISFGILIMSILAFKFIPIN